MAQWSCIRNREGRWRTAGTSRFIRRGFSRLLTFVGAWLIAVASAPCHAEEVVSIGVMSRSNRDIGRAHEQTIRYALHRLGETISVNGRQIRLKFEYETDRDDADAVEKARKLVNEKQVVALLGPVTSDAANAIVDAHLHVPIISSLATAPSLTAEQRDQWFFRAAVSDRERMKELVKFLDSDNRLARQHVVLYDIGAYGRGLKDELAKHLDPASLVNRDWPSLLTSETMETADLERGQGFTEEARGFLTDERNRSFLILGPSREAAKIASAIKSLRGPYRRARLFLVGSDKDLLRGAPEEATAIGEPALDDSDPVVDPKGGTFADLRDEFVERMGSSPYHFLLTAYEAAHFVIPKAVKSIVKKHGGVPNTVEFRDGIRQALETGTFDSLTPWRKVRFNGGDLESPPPVPIYRIRQAFERQNHGLTLPWARLTVPSYASYLEGPIRVGVEARHVEHEAVEVIAYRVAADDHEEKEEVERHVVAVADGQMATWEFHPPRPGQYRFETGPRVRFVVDDGKDADVAVGLDRDYPLAIFGGLLGALVAISRERTAARVALRLGLGMFTGALMFFLPFYFGSVPGSETLLRSASDPSAGAFVSGLIGGASGPTFLDAALRAIAPWSKGVSLLGRTSAAAQQV